MSNFFDFIRDLKKKDCQLYVKEEGVVPVIRALGEFSIHNIKVAGEFGKGTLIGIAFRASERQWNGTVTTLKANKIELTSAYCDQFGRRHFREL